MCVLRYCEKVLGKHGLTMEIENLNLDSCGSSFCGCPQSGLNIN